jgi:hypothetical protein
MVKFQSSKRSAFIASSLAAVILFTAVSIVSCGAVISEEKADHNVRFTEKEWREFRQHGERLLFETLTAYNKKDYDNFVKNFSSRRRRLSKSAFDALWEGDYKAKYGDFISKEFFPEKSNPVKEYPLLTYRAVFSASDDVGIRCVFARDDDGEYRIFYLRFDPYADLFY